jgi:hypothetical protein
LGKQVVSLCRYRIGQHNQRQHKFNQAKNEMLFDIGRGSALREVGFPGFCKLCAPVPLSGRIELLLVQTGQKGQAGRFRGMFQLPGMFGGAERIAAPAALQILPAVIQGLLRGLPDVHQRHQVGAATRAAVGVGVVFSAGWAG